MGTTIITRRVITFLVGAAALAGCAGSPGAAGRQPAAPPGNTIADKPAEEVVRTSLQALRRARSVHVRVSGKDAGKAVAMDLRMTARGEASGWLEQNGVRFNLITTGGRTYVSGRELWRQAAGAEAAEVIGDRWAVMTGVQGESLREGMTIDGLAGEFLKGAEDQDFALTLKSKASVGGRPAVRLRWVDGTYDVAATGRPYPLAMNAKEGPTSVTFTEYDEAFGIKPPANPLDLDKLR